MSTVKIENVGIAFVCTRNRNSSKPQTITRKFKTLHCGSVHEFVIRQTNNEVVSVVKSDRRCSSDCQHCAAQVDRAKVLISSGK